MHKTLPRIEFIFLKTKIKENFITKGLQKAQEKLSIMKLPEDEQKPMYNKDNLNYKANIFEFSFGDRYKVTRQMVKNMTKNKKSIEHDSIILDKI